MKTLAKISLLLVGGICLALPLSSGMTGARQNNPQNPGPTASPDPAKCPGLRDCTAEESNTPPQVQVEFPGPNGMTLHGHLYVPGVNSQADLATVTKKYPAVIYNHGSEPNPRGVPFLAKLYLDHGYIFFAPDRHGQGLSKDAGPYHADEQNKFRGTPQFGEMDVKLHELYNQDVIAAVEWFKKQPYVDPNHIAMTGISFGGIQTLLTALKNPGIRAFVAFAPAAQSWGVAELREHLVKVVREEKSPLFIIQARGDYNLGPVNTLGAVLQEKGNERKWKSKLYPQFGCTNQDAHARFSSHCEGIVIWNQDVLAFLNDWMK